MKRFRSKNFRVKFFIFLISLSTIYLIVLALFLFVFNSDKGNIVLNGNKEVTIKVGTPYNEEGALVYGKGNSSDVLIISSYVNSNVLGEYQVIYRYGSTEVIRKVKVIDDTNPVITLVGDETLLYCKGKDYKDPGVKVTDNYDKNLDDKVIVNKEDNYLKYEVYDSSGNYASIKRYLKEDDKTKPTITLTGGKNIVIYKGAKYVDRYTASDNCDGDITSSVVVTGSVDTNKIGNYELKYTVKDKSGNTTSVTRTVTVSSNTPTIYLTFDDGPSLDATPTILSTLKKYNVKATFFVLNHASNTDYLIKQEHSEGHTIGFHGYSHDYKTVYSTDEGFMNNIKKIEDKVVKLTGTDSKIIRFPGGSSNTISKDYNKGIMSRLVKKVSEEGYIYQDWNVGSNDTSTQDSTKICNNVIKGLGTKTNVVLMHDASGKTGSAKAVECIIKYGLEHGYTFKAMDSSTPYIHHGVNN